MNAICLVIDRLHAGYLGAYGNTWIATPTIDRLAAQSLVFDQALATTLALPPLYRSYWQGLHPLAADAPADQSLPAILSEAGISTALVSDDRTVCDHPLADAFDEVIELDPPWQSRVAQVGQFHETHLAQCFAQIIDWLETARGPFFLWCHLATLGATWDAPMEYRLRYQEEDDPPPPSKADVPDRLLAEHFDPDELLVHSQTYAGQVTLLDTCLAALDEALAESAAAEETLLALTAPRGFPLGEHRRLGPCDEPLYTELVQVPLMLRLPGGMGATLRSQALAEPGDLYGTLLDYWQIPPPGTAGSLLSLARGQDDLPRDRVVIVGRDGQRAIRTPAWYERLSGRVELFRKPDDRWEINDVVTRCQDVAEELQRMLMAYEEAITSGQPAALPPMSEVLLRGID
jgi:arylsulfatase A-like enzyme